MSGTRPPKSIARDLDACLQCGYCRETCPVFGQDPWESASPRGKVYMLKQLDRKGLMDRILTIFDRDINISDEFVERVYWCTSCGMCEQVCHVEIPFPELWEEVKEWLVEQGVAPLEAHKGFLTRIESVKNPFDEPESTRGDWADDFQMSSDPEVMYYVGCTESFRMQKIAKTTATVLTQANVPFNIMGDEEWCCTSPLLRTGQTKLTPSFAKHTSDLMKASGASVMITACAGCMATTKRDHTKALGGDLGYKVMHVSEYAAKLIDEGRLKFNRTVSRKVTYHDPCHLGRHAGVFDAPRKVLEAIPGIEFVEMPRNRETSRCCGAGAGFKAQFNEYAVNIGADRVQEAIDTGAEQIITTCPFCAVNLNAGAKQLGVRMPTIDLMQLVLEALGPSM
jgi:heterodisulfide reductase subunit D